MGKFGLSITNKLLFQKIGSNLLDFIRSCLSFDLDERPTPIQLLRHPIFSGFSAPTEDDIVLPHFPAINPSLCIIDIAQYKTKLGISEDHYKDALLDYPHEVLPMKKGSGQSWRLVFIWITVENSSFKTSEEVLVKCFF